MNCKVCDKPIDEHVEGRETDACVAEGVMEWKCSKNDLYLFGNGGQVSIWLWRPSERIVHAWEVVDKTMKPNWAWHMESHNIDGEVLWFATFWGDDEDGNIFGDAYSEAKSISLAICRAALKAVC